MSSALLGSFISAMATVMGALPLFVLRRIPLQLRDILIAFTAGIMVSASAFGLLPQALSESNLLTVTIGLLLGVIILDLIEKNVPHIDVEDKVSVNFDSKALLILASLFFHNIPEGLSTGLSYSSENVKLGPMVAIAIGSQNAPEGLIIALFLLNSGVSKLKSLWLVFLTGCVEMVSAVVGYFGASIVQPIIPYGLAFAAGAMLFIVYKELIPESHGNGNERVSTYSFIIGLLMMIYISYFFG